MKKIAVLILGLAIMGCAYEGQKIGAYFDNPRTLIRDPHFSEYKKQRDMLESKYLNKEITYADYVQAMDDLDNRYSREVQERNAKIAE